MGTDRGLCMVQSDASRETSLGEEAQLGYDELVELYITHTNSALALFFEACIHYLVQRHILPSTPPPHTSTGRSHSQCRDVVPHGVAWHRTGDRRSTNLFWHEMHLEARCEFVSLSSLSLSRYPIFASLRG